MTYGMTYGLWHHTASYERPTNPQGGLEAFLQRVAPDLDGAK